MERIMKKIILTTALLTFVFSKDTKEYYKIEGMFCGNGCANRIKNVIKTVDGIKKCDVNFEKSLMTLEFDDSLVNSELIIKSLTAKTTYKTTLLENYSEENTDSKSNESIWSKFKNIFKSKS